MGAPRSKSARPSALACTSAPGCGSAARPATRRGLRNRRHAAMSSDEAAEAQVKRAFSGERGQHFSSCVDAQLAWLPAAASAQGLQTRASDSRALRTLYCRVAEQWRVLFDVDDEHLRAANGAPARSASTRRWCAASAPHSAPCSLCSSPAQTPSTAPAGARASRARAAACARQRRRVRHAVEHAHSGVRCAREVRRKGVPRRRRVRLGGGHSMRTGGGCGGHATWISSRGRRCWLFVSCRAHADDTSMLMVTVLQCKGSYRKQQIRQEVKSRWCSRISVHVCQQQTAARAPQSGV